MEGTWEVVVAPATGKISSLKYDLHFACGYGVGFQKFAAHAIATAIDECYDIPYMMMSVNSVAQNFAERNAVRAPGHMEAALLMEAVMDGVCGTLHLAPHKV